MEDFFHITFFPHYTFTIHSTSTSTILEMETIVVVEVRRLVRRSRPRLLCIYVYDITMCHYVSLCVVYFAAAAALPGTGMSPGFLGESLEFLGEFLLGDILSG